MKVACFSDTHGQHKDVKLPECDLAIFAGDLSSVGYKHEVESFINWYNRQLQCKHRVFIAGNHEKSFDSKYLHRYEDVHKLEQSRAIGKPEWLVDMIKRSKEVYGTHYLENNEVIIEGLKVWGSPITPSFYREYWAFNADRGEEIQKYWDMIPSDTDILVSHGPVYGKLDYVPESREYVGCMDLKDVVEKIVPKLFVCGHIHSGRGVIPTTTTTFVNASVLDNGYDMVGDPIVIDLNVDNFII